MSKFTPLRLGFCALCSKRVFNNQEYIKSTEGYCHKICIRQDKVLEA